jgi:disulfide bond formation protein DsbB
VFLEVPQIVERIVTKDTVSVLENEFAKSAASVSDGLLSHSLETKPVQKPVEIQTKIVYRDSVIVQDRVVTEILEVEKELTGWQSFKMKMGGWFLGILIILIVLVILYFIKPLNLIKL